MADTKISSLTAASSLADTDELVLASAGASKKITGANLKTSIPGSLPVTIFDAKGDLIVASAADVGARIPVGTDGQVLQADSAQTFGVKWATPAGGAAGAVTLLSTITLGSTGAIDFTSIAGSYNDLILVGLIRSARVNTLANCGLHVNNDSGNNYEWAYVLGTDSSGVASTGTVAQPYAPYIICNADSASAGAFTAFHIEILNYTSTVAHKYMLVAYTTMVDTGGTSYSATGGARWRPSTIAAITRLTFWDSSSSSTSFITGSTVRLYGRT